MLNRIATSGSRKFLWLMALCFLASCGPGDQRTTTYGLGPIEEPPANAEQYYIYIDNMTFSPVDYLLRLIPNGTLHANQRVYDWSTGSIGVPGRVGPVILPDAFQIAMHDTDPFDGTLRVTGPIGAAFGSVIEFRLPADLGIPTLTLVDTTSPPGTVTLRVSVDTYKAMEGVFYWKDKPAYSWTDIYPGLSLVYTVGATRLEVTPIQAGQSAIGGDPLGPAVVFTLDPNRRLVHFIFEQNFPDDPVSVRRADY
ncbi:MAG: hypothetical protein K4571_20530 [Deltaproteobacteria bacterium]